MQNGILKYVSIFGVLILTSCFYFPISTIGMTRTNSKMLLAAVGLCIYLMQLARKRDGNISKDSAVLLLWAGLVSAITLIAVLYNNTRDYAYASYIVSMWVWIGAAYVVVNAIRWVHGQASVRLVGNYLIGVGVLQCILAVMIDGIPAMKQWVDTYFSTSSEFMDRINRLYGIGAMLDVGGTRFSVILIVIVIILMSLNEKESRKLTPLYLIAFIWIGIVGNMIARTTTVGIIIGILYLVYKTQVYKLHISKTEHIRLWIWWFILIIIALVTVSYLYQTDVTFRHDIRFAFEGFFSLAEEGEWNVASNNTLKNMYVFPENLKTWIIGDGYFSNPIHIDPYFTGKIIGGFYMGTDVGYLRFIFYFGVTGLVAFTLFMCKVARVCMNRFVSYRSLFGVILLLNFAVWFKVSTDIFLVFALFLCMSGEENQPETSA